MNSYTEAISYLYGLQKFGMKFGLTGIRALLRAVGNPHKQLRAIHVAGTNGKGSVASMTASIFTAAGYKTGLYTSPHLIDFSERIRINGKPIPQKRVVQFVRLLRPVIERRKSTFFEVVTAMAFNYFAEEKVDIAVIETGLGGRLDATNVVNPLVSVITSIELEHTEILGKKIEAIAMEKAGIIKPRIPVVTAVESKHAMQVIWSVGAKNKSRIVSFEPQSAFVHESSFDGLNIDLIGSQHEYRGLKISAAGEFQVRNAGIALLAAEIAAQRGNFAIDERAIRKGFGAIQANSGLQARLSIIQKNPLVIADVAHNPEAVQMLVHALRSLGLNRFIVVFGVLKDKNFRPMVSSLSQIVARAIVVEPATERARSARDLEKEFRRRRVPTINAGSVREGVQLAKSLRLPYPILITGSNFVVGEALAEMLGKKYLTISQ